MNGAADLAKKLQQEFSFLSESLVHRWVRSYGTRTTLILGAARSRSDLGDDFGHGLYAIEVDYLIDHEWAQTAEDILWRRSKLGLRFSAAEVKMLESYVTAQVERHSC